MHIQFKELRYQWVTEIGGLEQIGGVQDRVGFKNQFEGELEYGGDWKEVQIDRG